MFRYRDAPFKPSNYLVLYLAHRSWLAVQLGVIGIQWRVVDCASHKPVDGSEAGRPAPTQSMAMPLSPAQDIDMSVDLPSMHSTIF